MLQIFEPDDPLVLNDTYDIYGYTPKERRALEKKRAKEQRMAKRERSRTDVEMLPCKLTDSELQHYGAKLATQTTEIEALKATQKAEKKKMREELELLEDERNTLAGIIESGEEDRKVAVEIWFNNEKLAVEMIRTDTNELVSTRAMTEQERQMPLQG